MAKMKKCDVDRFGGAKVHLSKTRYRTAKIIGLLLMMFIFYSSSAFAQGSIFGSVVNSDVTVPANGEMSFFGFLDDTDEEIRIETSVGAGYDNGNWFDDFQNYLTEAPGNPYDYYFYNIANGQGAILSKLIPNNSFQQENILLAPVTWPAIPLGLTGRAVSSSSVVITWTAVPGMTYHVYRRLASSSGSLFRIDDPTGNMANRGVAGGYFVDNTVNGVSIYNYMIIAENDAGNLSPHSGILTVNSATIQDPVLLTISPRSGSYVGGTPVTISGNGFDMNGATVTIAGNPLVSTVIVSPMQITGLTPAGTIGFADVIVTNSASGLISAPLIGGFEYLANATPVLDPIGPQAVTEGSNLNFAISASDVDGTTPVLFTSTPLPGTSTFIDNGNGTGTFDWTPGYADAGVYQVTFFATDDIDTVSEIVDITVNDAGNQPPVLDPIGPQTVAEGNNLNLVISSSDLDGDIPSLSATNVPTNATFADNGDGTGVFDFNPDLTQAGIYSVTFKAFDGTDVDSEVVDITVTDSNQLPILAPIGPQTGTEGVNLNFAVMATDPDGTTPVLFTSTPLPGTAMFTDNGDGTGTFDWTPSYVDAGLYQVTFYAADDNDTVSEIVDITIGDGGNQPPVMDPIGPQFVDEGVSLNFTVTASDADLTVPVLYTSTPLPAGATFIDNGDGTGVFDWTPAFDQAGVHQVTFYAADDIDTVSELVDITVTDAGNQAPVISGAADTTISEGDSLIIVITAADPDGGIPTLSASATFSASDYSFIDSGNGVGVFSYYTDYYDYGIDSVWFTAVDAADAGVYSRSGILLTVNDVNQPPVIDPIGPVGVVVDDTLTLLVTASDPTDPSPTSVVALSAIGMPANASFVDNGDNTGTLTFAPDDTQQGVHTVTFVAADIGSPPLDTTLTIEITVVLENRPPDLVVDPAFAIFEGEPLVIPISATDPDGTTPIITATRLPANSGLETFGDGTAQITFDPDYTQAGLYGIEVRATDGIALTKKNVLIQVYEAGNQDPIVDPVSPQTVTEGDTLTFTVSAFDPDGTIPSLSADSLPINANFTDNGDGTGTLEFYPVYVQEGIYNIYIIATDGELTDTMIVTITVDDAGNQSPVLAAIEDKLINENQLLNFTVSSSDPDSTPPVLTVEGLPAGATFTDNGDYTGSFNWTPGYDDAGAYVVSFIATDVAVPFPADTVEITIAVNNVNQLPRLALGGETLIEINEGDTLHYLIYAMDDDGSIPFIEADTIDYTLVNNMSFEDSANGKGVLTFTPDYTQGDDLLGFKNYFMGFWAIDSEYPEDTVTGQAYQIQIKVFNVNLPPVINPVNDTTVVEGDTVLMQITATDDASVPTLSAENMPSANASFAGPAPHSKLFRFYPDYTQAGVYTVRFIATDNMLAADTLEVTITVQESGNHAPQFDTTTVIHHTLVAANRDTTLLILANDLDADPVTITVNDVVTNAIFVDSGNGAATYRFAPAVFQIDSIYNIEFYAVDPAGAADTLSTVLRVIALLRGDANSDTELNMLDIVYLINYLYKAGPDPASMEAADVNYDLIINLMDAAYLINFFYKGGPAPPE